MRIICYKNMTGILSVHGLASAIGAKQMADIPQQQSFIPRLRLYRGCVYTATALGRELASQARATGNETVKVLP